MVITEMEEIKLYLISNLVDSVFKSPYEKGYRSLRILTGYASSAFLIHILNSYPEIKIDLIIGMSKKDGINKWDHNQYKKIDSENSNVNIFYQKSLPAIHTKIYQWTNNDLLEECITFIGSANFSWNGFRDQQELLAEVNYNNSDDIFNVIDGISCKDENVKKFINMNVFHHQDSLDPLQTTDDLYLPLNIENLKYVELPLLRKSDTEISNRSGLNWGQRHGREQNQAYIPVPLKVHLSTPNFFPLFKQTFTLITDDNRSFICIMAQTNRKAIQSSPNTSLIGKYFRERLKVPLGKKVEVEDVLNYGRSSLRIYKIDPETYFMDFSNVLS